ncbi:MAG: hypothetical protein LBG15_13280 [Dysgonamonadaceae bacterium]|jgi:hypothetical protein|nr:hypothetical protein [Dysgonamonadaceae bacterium]
MNKLILTVILAALVFTAKAQDKASALNFSAGADVVSSYIWRGSYLGAASIQPGIGLDIAGFSVGAWGSTDFTGVANKEVDLTIGYEIAGLSLAVTDYWIVEQGGGDKYFNYDDKKGSAHTLEATLGYTLPVKVFPLSLSLNTVFAGADGINEKGKKAYSTYVEASYPFAVKDIALDATVGFTPWATTFYGADGFSVINISLKASKEIKITDSFTLPLFGQFIVNPRTEDTFLVVGITF